MSRNKHLQRDRHLRFSKLSKFLTVEKAKKVEVHQRAKFCRNRLNRGRDMVIFVFFMMAAAAILDF